MDEHAVRQRVARVEEALEALDGLPAEPRLAATDAVRCLVELYGEGLARVLAQAERVLPDFAITLAEDELLSHLLMIHGLHPLDVATRVRRAVADVQATVNVRGREIEVLSVDESSARLRFRSNGHTQANGLRDLVEQAVRRAAPELARVHIEMPATAAGPNGAPALVQLQGLPARTMPSVQSSEVA